MRIFWRRFQVLGLCCFLSKAAQEGKDCVIATRVIILGKCLPTITLYGGGRFQSILARVLV